MFIDFAILDLLILMIFQKSLFLLSRLSILRIFEILSYLISRFSTWCIFVFDDFSKICLYEFAISCVFENSSFSISWFAIWTNVADFLKNRHFRIRKIRQKWTKSRIGKSKSKDFQKCIKSRIAKSKITIFKKSSKNRQNRKIQKIIKNASHRELQNRK